jgi:flavin reductase (DIM6/NTAB) family NADH-FMN oxidoreductase RutF
MTASHSAPPQVLEQDLELAPGDWPGADFYRITTALVIPRPVGWISTISAAGTRNLAPYSYFNLMGSDPCYAVFASDGVKDSITNLREVPQFVANIATMDLLERMHFTSADFPREEDENAWAGLTPVASATVRPSRVLEAKAHLECEVAQIFSDRDTHIVLGRLLHVHVGRSVWKDGRIDPRLLDPVCRLSGAYASLGEHFSIDKPAWTRIKGTSALDGMPRARKR